MWCTKWTFFCNFIYLERASTSVSHPDNMVSWKIESKRKYWKYISFNKMQKKYFSCKINCLTNSSQRSFSTCLPCRLSSCSYSFSSWGACRETIPAFADSTQFLKREIYCLNGWIVWLQESGERFSWILELLYRQNMKCYLNDFWASSSSSSSHCTAAPFTTMLEVIDRMKMTIQILILVKHANRLHEIILEVDLVSSLLGSTWWKKPMNS